MSDDFELPPPPPRRTPSDAQISDKVEEMLHAPDEAETAMIALTTPITTNLPTTWHDAAGKTHLRGAGTQVVPANADDIKNYGFAPTRVCGTCKHFNLRNGREEIAKQKFAHRLVRENQWQMHHLGVPLDQLGLCGQSNGELATTSISNAGNCAGYSMRTDIARKVRGGGE